MAVENRSYSVNDLEHAKFTSDSDSNNSIVQTQVINQKSIANQELDSITRMAAIEVLLGKICSQLETINSHLSYITETDF